MATPLLDWWRDFNHNLDTSRCDFYGPNITGLTTSTDQAVRKGGIGWKLPNIHLPFVYSYDLGILSLTHHNPTVLCDFTVTSCFFFYPLYSSAASTAAAAFFPWLLQILNYILIWNAPLYRPVGWQQYVSSDVSVYMLVRHCCRSLYAS